MQRVCQRNESKSKQTSHSTMDQTKSWEKKNRDLGVRE